MATIASITNNETNLIYIPTDKLKAFTNLVKKCRKYFQLEYKIESQTSKVFYHEDIEGKLYPQYHTVFPCYISQIMSGDWVLVASIINGVMCISDMTNEIKFKDNHGVNVHICEECGHKMKNSYIIRNVKTQIEMQVGGECVKKFGIPCKPQTFSQIINELNFFCNGVKNEKWCYTDKDYSAIEAHETNDIMACAIAYYATNKTWKSGYYNSSDIYVKSQSQSELQSLVKSNIREIVSLKYINAIKNYIQTELNKKSYLSEFEEKMLALSNDFYCTIQDCAAAFFMVKKYEDYQKEITSPLQVKKNDFIQFSAKLTHTEILDGMFGSYEKNTLITNKNIILIRNGKINTDINKIVNGYAQIKAITKNYEIILDRVTKAPKKGITYIKLD